MCFFTSESEFKKWFEDKWIWSAIDYLQKKNELGFSTGVNFIETKLEGNCIPPFPIGTKKRFMEDEAKDGNSILEFFTSGNDLSLNVFTFQSQVNFQKFKEHLEPSDSWLNSTMIEVILRGMCKRS